MKRKTLTLPRFVVLQDGEPVVNDDKEIKIFKLGAANLFANISGGVIVPVKDYNFNAKVG